MTSPTVRPVILCGGAGTRLWPVSRDSLPKQFIPLLGARSTFQETVLRVGDPGLYGTPIVITSALHRFIVERQLREIAVAARIVVEPVRRDSGPAILAACALVAREDPAALVLVLAADHVVRDADAFNRAVRAGLDAADFGRIVTFGIEPSHAAVEYGYIEPRDAVEGEARSIGRFAEKPDPDMAADYVARGFLWNSGNFLIPPETLMEEYARLDPQTFAAVTSALAHAREHSGALTLDPAAFERAAKLSIDYAVMEHTHRAAVVATACGWSDLGNWDALWSESDGDGDGNATADNVEMLDTHNCYVSTDRALTCLIGVEDLVVVAQRDAILVADRRRSGEVKQLVERLRAQGRSEADTHAKVYRPWGWYQVLEGGDQFQVKRIAVYPQGRLSLQKHRHRAEHWVVVCGTARVTVDEDVRLLGMNEHAHIPLGAVHRLENPGNAMLEIIEVQSGAYLGEDDIVRLEDIYDRV